MGFPWVLFFFCKVRFLAVKMLILTFQTAKKATESSYKNKQKIVLLSKLLLILCPLLTLMLEEFHCQF